MAEASRDFKKYLFQKLIDPVEAAAYIEAALEDGDEAALLLALRDVIEARSLSEVAKSTGLNRENLYRMLTEKGNPRLSSLVALLEAVGLRLSVDVLTISPVTNSHKRTEHSRISEVSVTTKMRSRSRSKQLS